jgi:hypothetical protein
MATNTTTELYEILITTNGVAEIQKVSKAMEDANRIAREAAGQFDKIPPKVKEIGRAGEEASKGIGNVGNKLQNASFQIADFAVQVGGGTSAVRALSQQLPQVLGAFGVWGAVAGAAVAVIGGLIPVLFDTGEKAVDTEKQISKLTGALDDYTKFTQTASKSTEELSKTFGRFAQETKDNAKWFADVKLGEANAALGKNAAGLTQGLNAFTQAQKNAAEAGQQWLDAKKAIENGVGSEADLKNITDQFELTKQAIDDTAKSLGLTSFQAVELRENLKKMDGAKSVLEIRDAAQATINSLMGMFAAGQTVPPEIVKIVDGLKDVRDAATQSVIAAEGIGTVIRAAVDDSSALEASWAKTSKSTGEAEAAAYRHNKAVAESNRLSALLAEWYKTIGGWAIEVAGSSWQIAAAIAAATDAKLRFSQTGTEASDALDPNSVASFTANAKAIADAKAKAEAAARAAAAGAGAANSAARADDNLSDAIASTQKLIDLLKQLNPGAATEYASQLFADIHTNAGAVRGDVVQITKDIKETGKATAKALKEAQDNLKKVTDIFQSNISDNFDAIIDHTKTVQDAFKDMLTGILADIAKFLVQRQITSLINLLAGSFGAGVNALNTPIYTPPGSASPAASSNGFAASTRGVTSSSGTTSNVNPGPPSNPAEEKAKQSLVVNINNTVSDDVKVTATQNSQSMGAQLDIIIERKVKQLFGSGRMDKSMHSNFGARRVPG